MEVSNMQQQEYMPVIYIWRQIGGVSGFIGCISVRTAGLARFCSYRFGNVSNVQGIVQLFPSSMSPAELLGYTQCIQIQDKGFQSQYTTLVHVKYIQ